MIDRLAVEQDNPAITVPDGLDGLVSAAIEGTDQAWDDAVWTLAPGRYGDGGAP